MTYQLNVKGKTILLTGGYGYLGKAIAKSLADHGGRVYVMGPNPDKFQKAFPDEPAKVFYQHLDVAKADSIQAAFQAVLEKENSIDVLINNAFYSRGQSPELMADEDWAYGIDGTLNSVFRCIKAVIPYFKGQGRGKIINVSSMYGVIAPNFKVYDDFPDFLNPPHYGAAKAGILQMTRYYASFLGRHNIQVNAVTPGAFPSEGVQEQTGFIEKLAEQTALGRIGAPDELAGAFVFLASEAANYITGQNIVVDGGWTIK